MTYLPWFDRLPHPFVIAHRGSSLEAPENTLAAFQLAIQQGAEAIELDVTTCASGDLVVIHDTTVDRTSDGSGKVADLQIEQLKSLDAGSWFKDAYVGETIPTLDEVFEAIGQLCYINVELKNYTTPFDKLAEKVARCVKNHNLQDRIFFSSFNPINFRKIKRLLPGSPIGLLTVKGMSRPIHLRLSRVIGPYTTLNPHYSDASALFIERSHQVGMPVFPYTVNDAEKIRQLVSTGVDGVITDNPILAKKIIQAESNE